jgi:hypothetical protein
MPLIKPNDLCFKKKTGFIFVKLMCLVCLHVVTRCCVDVKVGSSTRQHPNVTHCHVNTQHSHQHTQHFDASNAVVNISHTNINPPTHVSTPTQKHSEAIVIDTSTHQCRHLQTPLDIDTSTRERETTPTSSFAVLENMFPRLNVFWHFVCFH